jgi:crotonyl-CoA carboxylase/reductase
MNKDIYEIGEKIELGVIPEFMYAVTLREERFGEPNESMRIEKVKVPDYIDEYEVLIKVVVAGINHNVIWAGRGRPLNVIQNCKKLDLDQRDYFIPGSDGAGIVWKIGKKVTNVNVGDEVIIQSGYLGKESDMVKRSEIPNIRAWGYEVNGGTLAQFTKVQSYQCIKKPSSLTWEEAGGCLVGAATSYRMLCHWKPNDIKENDPVLIWGGASGIGSMAIQIAKMKGARPIAVVSTEEKADYCKSIGAIGIINRNDFENWGKMPDINDTVEFAKWREHVKKFRYAFFEALGEKKSPLIVFEHPGENTFSTSLAVVDKFGMVVTCGGTSGYYGNFDLRQLWVYQKRVQGSHFASLDECKEVINLLGEKKIESCIGKVYKFKDAIKAHDDMAKNKQPGGNSVIMIE